MPQRNKGTLHSSSLIHLQFGFLCPNHVSSTVILLWCFLWWYLDNKFVCTNNLYSSISNQGQNGGWALDLYCSFGVHRMYIQLPLAVSIFICPVIERMFLWLVLGYKWFRIFEFWLVFQKQVQCMTICMLIFAEGGSAKVSQGDHANTPQQSFSQHSYHLQFCCAESIFYF